MRTTASRISSLSSLVTIFAVLGVTMLSGRALVQAEDSNSVYLPVILAPAPSPYAYTFPLVIHGEPHCEVIAQYPPDVSVFQAGSTFYVHWQIRNLSDKTWQTASAVILYYAGIKYGNPSYYLPYDVSPQSSVEISIPLAAPPKDGVYSSHWMIKEVRKCCAASIYNSVFFDPFVIQLLLLDSHPE